MSKKYLSLDEAAKLVGISTDELTRSREKGELRGFADRGTWKFKVEDVEEYGRRRQTDSDPEVPLISDLDLDEQGTSDDERMDSSSILGAEEDALGEQPTTIRKKGMSDSKVLADIDDGEGTSDSDVRLILDDSLTAEGSDEDVSLPAASGSDSDSDVALVGDSAVRLDPGSDSDVKLIDEDSDSDVALIPDAGSGRLSASGESTSDSDVRLIGRKSSDSDVALSGDAMETDEDISVLGEEEPSGLGLGESGISLAAESGISLEGPADSGISLESRDSDLGLDASDSGISLMDIAAEEDEGISLADDSLADDGLDETIPMLKEDDEISLDTEFEVPALKGRGSAGEADTSEVPSLEADEESDFQLGSLDAADEDQSVLLFEDEEDVDDRSATVVHKGRKEDDEYSEDSFSLESSADEFSTSDDSQLEVADDVMGEDDELDELDVFDAGDEDFDESFETGEVGHAEFLAPVGQVAAPEVPWDGVTFGGLVVATVSMAVCGMVMFDLVRSMWHWNDYSAFSSPVIEVFGGLFK